MGKIRPKYKIQTEGAIRRSSLKATDGATLRWIEYLSYKAQVAAAWGKMKTDLADLKGIVWPQK